MGVRGKLHGGSAVHQNAGTLREFGIRAHWGQDEDEGSARSPYGQDH